MNVRHKGVLHSFSIRNFFHDKVDVRFYFHAKLKHVLGGIS